MNANIRIYIYKDTSASCALWTQPYPVNYRGRQVHKDLHKFRRIFAPTITSWDQISKPYFFSTQSFSRDPSQQSVSNQLNFNDKSTYVNATSKKISFRIHIPTHDSIVLQSSILVSFFEEFKSLISPLILFFTSRLLVISLFRQSILIKFTYCITCKYRL